MTPDRARKIAAAMEAVADAMARLEKAQAEADEALRLLKVACTAMPEKKDDAR